MMQRTWTTRGALLGLGMLALGPVAGCGRAVECPEPAYQGGTTDEAWRALVDAEGRVQRGDSLAPVPTAPGDGAVLRAGEAPPTVRWTSPLALVTPAAPSFTPQPPRPTSPRSLLARGWRALAEALLPVAHAHGTPLTGDAYLASLRLPGEACPVERFTTQLDWTLTQAEWDRVRAAAPGEVTLTLTSAEFRDNAVTSGPFRPASELTFRVEE
jgi:hypothetical protein